MNTKPNFPDADAIKKTNLKHHWHAFTDMASLDEKQLRLQMKELPYYNTFFKSTHSPVAQLAEKIASLTPGDLNRIFFNTSGSDSNDTVLRIARAYWAGKGKPEKTIVIARKNAYHGSTMAGVTLGGMEAMHSQGGPLIPDIVHIDQPY